MSNKPMNKTAEDVLKEYQILTCDMTVAQVELMKLAMEEYRNQPTPPAKVEGVEQMAEAYKIIETLVDLKNIKDRLDQVKQQDQNQEFVIQYGNYVTDKAKAWNAARKFLIDYHSASPPLPQADKVEDAVNEMKYWKTRCHLAETCMKESPCDPDITTSQIEAHKAYDEFVNSTPNH